jgi:hypothetical protein
MWDTAANFAVITVFIGAAGIFVGWYFLDAATCDIATLVLFFLAARINAESRRALIPAIVILLVTAIGDGTILHRLLLNPADIKANGRPVGDFARIGMSLWLGCKIVWSIVACWAIGRCLVTARAAGESGAGTVNPPIDPSDRPADSS